MKKLSLLFVFLVAGFGASLAQNTIVLNNSDGNSNASYYNGGIRVSVKFSSGTIYLYTGPVSLPAPSPTSTSYFSGPGPSSYAACPKSVPCFHYTLSSVGTGTTTNVAGTLAWSFTQTSTKATYNTYNLNMTFVGSDSNGVPFSGNTSQLITLKTSLNGSISVTYISGTTYLTY